LAKAELKTKLTKASVAAFLKRVADADRRKDCQTVARIMEKAVKAEPRMWGANIVGFGTYHHKYASGREADWFLAGFAPRKLDLTLYIMGGLDRFPAILERLGKYKIRGSCLHVKRLADVDQAVLGELVSASVKHMKQAHN
jgi:Domain of unknown function (DU1801)